MSGAAYLPEQGFPAWLQTFDANNNEHEVAASMFDRLFANLAQKPPPAWREKETLRILEIAPGDGRFSRTILDTIARHLGKKIEYVGVELNPQAAAEARRQIQEGLIIESDMHREDLKTLLPHGFTPDLTLVSHAIYFTHDQRRFTGHIAALGGDETLTLYLNNSAISSALPDHLGDFNKALARGPLKSYHSATETSHIRMPAADPFIYLERFKSNPSPEGLDAPGIAMFNMLSFLQQKALNEVTPQARLALIDEVEQKLRRHDGVIPIENQLTCTLSPRADHALCSVAEQAMKQLSRFKS